MNDRKRLFKQIQVLSFAVYEAALYLDGHPNDKCALDYYKKKRAFLSELYARYEKHYGPLTLFSDDSCEHWRWTESPWPWEYESE